MKYFKIDVFTRNDSEDHLKKKIQVLKLNLWRSLQGFQFCSYPFLFDAAAKSILLQTDATLQMQVRNSLKWSTCGVQKNSYGNASKINSEYCLHLLWLKTNLFNV